MLIELIKDFYFDPETGTVLKGTGRKQCALFPPGASAIDGGFSLPYSAKKVAGAIVDESDEPVEGDEDEEGEDGNDDED